METSKRYVYVKNGPILKVLFADEREAYIEWETNGCRRTISADDYNGYKEYKEPRTITRWINVYERYGELKIFNECSTYDTEEDAKRFGAKLNGYKDTIPITYTEPL